MKTLGMEPGAQERVAGSPELWQARFLRHQASTISASKKLPEK